MATAKKAAPRKSDVAVTKPKEFLAKTPKATGVTLKMTPKGKYYVCTHRAKSNLFNTPGAIPKKTIEFIESTG